MDTVYELAPGSATDPDGPLLDCLQKALGHDLPNQLVAVQGLARLLLTEAGDRLDAEGRGLLERLAELTRQADASVRALARAGRLLRRPAPAEEVSLAAAAAEAGAEAKLLCGGPVVEYHVEQPLTGVFLPRTALHQVLVELLRNAFRAAAPGRPLRVTVGARETPGGLAVTVADDGRGIPPTVVPHLGEPSPPGRDPGSPGLGLFLAVRLVGRWGGGFRVATAAGVGTAVTFVVPGPAAVPPRGGAGVNLPGGTQA